MKTIVYFWSKLYPFEKLVLLYLVFTYCFASLKHFTIDLLWGYFFYHFFSFFAFGFILLIGYFIVLSIVKRSMGTALTFFKKNYFNFYFVFDCIRIAVATIITLILYLNLKQAIHLVNPRLFDNFFLNLDKIIHFNYSPILLSLKIPIHSWIWGFIDKLYVTFFPKNIIFLWIFILQTKSKILMQQFVMAFCLLWILGGLCYFLFPALGPCYYLPDLFKNPSTPIATYLQKLLWNAYTNGPTHKYLKSFLGIAAMPSLHIAFSFLCAIFSYKISKLLCLFTCIYTMLILFGSVILGWHYTIDGYAGIILSILIYLLSKNHRLLA